MYAQQAAFEIDKESFPPEKNGCKKDMRDVGQMRSVRNNKRPPTSGNTDFEHFRRAVLLNGLSFSNQRYSCLTRCFPFSNQLVVSLPNTINKEGQKYAFLIMIQAI